MTIEHRWIGNDHPEDWALVGSLDLGDPADIEWAEDRGYRLGTSYESWSGPSTVDVYERIPASTVETDRQERG